MRWWGTTLIIILLVLFFSALVGASFLKLHLGLYNALDLGIFNQVFWQTTHGNLFGMTIHPHSYLGDHLNLFILLLAPLYALIPRPETLLVLQVLAVTLTPIPLLVLTKERQHPTRFASFLMVFVIFLWVINPYLHNAVFFEFHALIFAAPLLTTAYAAYRKNNFKLYLIALSLLFILREDLSLTILAFCFLAFLERKPWKWWAPQSLLAVLWFFGATAISARLNTGGSYKFLYLYGWMGTSLQEILQFIFTKPFEVLRHLFPKESLALLKLVFSSFLFLPLAAPKSLLLGIPSLLVVGLTAGGLNAGFFTAHYQIIFLTTLLIACFDLIPRLIDWHKHHPIGKKLIGASVLILTLLSFLSFFQASSYSPFFVREINGGNIYRLPQKTPEIRKGFIDDLTDVQRVMVGSGFLSDFSDREELMTLHYTYIGTKQFSKEDFPLPSIDAALFDGEEILRLIVSQNSYDWLEGIRDGSGRLRMYLERENLHPARTVDDTILYTKDGTLTPFSLKTASSEKTCFGHVTLSSCGDHPCLDAETLHQAHGDDVLMRFSLFDQDETRVWQSLYLPAYGLYMPHEFTEPHMLTTHFELVLPRLLEGTYTAKITLESIKGIHALTGLRNAGFIPSEEPLVFDDVQLGSLVIDGDGVRVEGSTDE